MWGPATITLSVAALFITCFVQTEASGKDPVSIEASSRLVSALCGLSDVYKESQTMPNVSLKSPPPGVTLLAAPCDTFVRKCSKRQCTEWSVEKGSKCSSPKGTRVIGGQDASASDAPWDMNFKYVFNWGPSGGNSGRFTEKEKAENDVKGILEQHRCSGIFYRRQFIITTGWCGAKGNEFAPTTDRFVAWLARRRFLRQDWCVYKSDKQSLPTSCKIHIHPKFQVNLGPINKTGSNAGIQDRDYDISIVNMLIPTYDFKRLGNTRALPFAKKGQEFTGQAMFAGWGTTIENLSYTQVGSEGHGGQAQRPGYTTVLQKINLNIIPFKPECEELVHWYIEKAGGKVDSSKDYSQMYMCAKPMDGKTQGLCGGDIGGALVCTEGGTQYVCGMRNSWGATEHCLRDDDQLEIFLKMGFFSDWIKEIAGDQTPADLNP